MYLCTTSEKCDSEQKTFQKERSLKHPLATNVRYQLNATTSILSFHEKPQEPTIKRVEQI